MTDTWPIPKPAEPPRFSAKLRFRTESGQAGPQSRSLLQLSRVSLGKMIAVKREPLLPPPARPCPMVPAITHRKTVRSTTAGRPGRAGAGAETRAQPGRPLRNAGGARLELRDSLDRVSCSHVTSAQPKHSHQTRQGRETGKPVALPSHAAVGRLRGSRTGRLSAAILAARIPATAAIARANSSGFKAAGRFIRYPRW